MPARRITATSRQLLASLCAATALLVGCDDTTPGADDADASTLADAADDESTDRPDHLAPPPPPEQAIANAMPFGTMCQADFQYNWTGALPYTWNRCGGFNSVFSQIATQNFFWNLASAKAYIENTLDMWGADSVQLLYLATHGGVAAADTSVGAYAMWDNQQFAYTKSMRFDTLSMFSGYACKTLQIDGNLASRWFPAMAGGLSVVTGSHNLLWDSWYTDDVGADYADNLKSQWSVHDAWIDGLWDAYTTQDVAILAAGANPDDCTWRLYGMNPYNYVYYPRRHDGEIGHMCWSYITE